MKYFLKIKDLHNEEVDTGQSNESSFLNSLVYEDTEEKTTYSDEDF